MDLITQTSLEALLLKATNSKNLNFDTAAVEAFCTLINKEKDGAHIGIKVISARLPSGNEKEVLQTLNVLDTCMSKCGSHFQNEVGKFRFLNEMIKLVSPKYLGAQTPLTVKQKVLQLLYVWTLDYPKETKIKEAFDMLRKQGVIREIPNPNVPSYESVNGPKKKSTSSIFYDEEKSKILQKLLQSKDPEDIQAANWLIKSMVKEDDKRAELKSKSISELESIQNNIRLLNEMLDSYQPDVSSDAELDLIKELHQNCERLRSTINKLALESQHTEGLLACVLEASDELTAACNKYNFIIVQGRTFQQNFPNSALLSFDLDPNYADIASKIQAIRNGDDDGKSSVDVLCDIFTASNIPDGGEVLQPVPYTKCDKSSVNDDTKEKTEKFKALEELDVLGEHLIKENLQSARQSNYNKNIQDKTPMNLLSKFSGEQQGQASLPKDNESFLDLNYLIKQKTENKPLIPAEQISHDTSDDFLVDISDEKMLEVEKTSDVDSLHNLSDNEAKEKAENQNGKFEKTAKCDIKLNDIFIKLENIKPSSFPPMTVVTLHLAKDKPKERVNVYVITTVSKNQLPLSNYLFQAVVPKGCKLKLQPPSATNLPAYNPFLPPSAITQIMLTANPEGTQMSLKFIISYVMDDETITEMGE
ncbi:hypothetical protein NQ318_001610, partial [Aromia moschata]